MNAPSATFAPIHPARLSCVVLRFPCTIFSRFRPPSTYDYFGRRLVRHVPHMVFFFVFFPLRYASLAVFPGRFAAFVIDGQLTPQTTVVLVCTVCPCLLGIRADLHNAPPGLDGRKKDSHHSDQRTCFVCYLGLQQNSK